jgi:hypothetical protein
MKNKIFSDRERKILEEHLINPKIDNGEIKKILNQISTKKNLFDDVFLYLQVKKTLNL